MQRFAAVWHASPRKLMGVLLLLLLAAGMAVGSGASFTAESASPGNMVAAGSLAIDNDKKNDGVQTAIFDIANMAPGQSDGGYVTVENTGTVPGGFNLALDPPVAGGAGSNLSPRLQLTVQEVDQTTNAVVGTPFPIAAVNTMGATNPLGTWAAGEKHKYKFTVTWPTGLSGDDAFQGSTLKLDFKWNAVSA